MVFIFLLIALTTTISFLVLGNYQIKRNEEILNNTLIHYKENFRTWGLYDKDVSNLNYTLGGLYYGNGYYCVNTRLRNFTEIELTDRHEYAHHLVREDYKHFCSIKNVSVKRQK